MLQVGYDPETKSFDVDRATSKISSSERSKIIQIKEMVKKLEEKYGKQISLDILREQFGDKISDHDFEEAIEKLKKSGDLFQPKSGFVQGI
jgi:replicative DNA helicase Mcm